MEATQSLPAPSLDLARHATRELEYAERFIIHSMNPAAGGHETIVYSIGDATRALFGTDWGSLLADGSKASFSWVDVESLVKWVGDVIGDRPLADALAEASSPEDSYRDRLLALEPLFLERLRQYREVIEAHERPDEPQGT